MKKNKYKINFTIHFKKIFKNKKYSKFMSKKYML